ncbi:MAG TPA: putative toxin-antitoxin system toxin component, PIN family [Candidatus Angelobacter sp.]|nr:putative toxin-antitoxin system toxin component, PIN family [Candidatus Angelobacter sp.]
MVPLRLVLDTNILVSAALNAEGLPRTVFLLAITKPARLYVSAPVLEEYKEVLSRKELGIRKGLRQQFLQLIRNRAHMVTPKKRINSAHDPEDDKFLECADAARADYLITGNERHFPKYWKSTKIIGAREFVDFAGRHLIE